MVTIHFHCIREEQHRLSAKYLLLPFTLENNVIRVWDDAKMIK